MTKTNVIFLCSEITRGMKSYGPKATILLGKKKEPLIVKQIKQTIKLYPDCNIHIVVGFGHQKIQKIIYDHGLANRINFIFHDNYENHNNGGAFLAGISMCHSDSLFINNGVILNERINSEQCCVPIINGKNVDNFLIGSTIEKNKVQYLFYDLENKWSETVFIPSTQINNIKNLVNDQKDKLSKMFLFEIINYLIDNNISFISQVVSNQKLQKILTHKNT